MSTPARVTVPGSAAPQSAATATSVTPSKNTGDVVKNPASERPSPSSSISRGYFLPPANKVNRGGASGSAPHTLATTMSRLAGKPARYVTTFETAPPPAKDAPSFPTDPVDAAAWTSSPSYRYSGSSRSCDPAHSTAAAATRAAAVSAWRARLRDVPGMAWRNCNSWLGMVSWGRDYR